MFSVQAATNPTLCQVNDWWRAAQNPLVGWASGCTHVPACGLSLARHRHSWPQERQAERGTEPAQTVHPGVVRAKLVAAVDHEERCTFDVRTIASCCEGLSKSRPSSVFVRDRVLLQQRAPVKENPASLGQYAYLVVPPRIRSRLQQRTHGPKCGAVGIRILEVRQWEMEMMARRPRAPSGTRDRSSTSSMKASGGMSCPRQQQVPASRRPCSATAASSASARAVSHEHAQASRVQGCSTCCHPPAAAH